MRTNKYKKTIDIVWKIRSALSGKKWLH